MKNHLSSVDRKARLERVLKELDEDQRKRDLERQRIVDIKVKAQIRAIAWMIGTAAESCQKFGDPFTEDGFAEIAREIWKIEEQR